MRIGLVFALIILSSFSLKGQNRFSNDLLMKVIYQHQYDQNTTALLPYLRHTQQKYRYAAAIAFASVQDSSAVDSLIAFFKNEKDIDVQKALVLSLGQLRLNSVTKRLIVFYNDKKLVKVKNELLMAIGKGANMSDLNFYNKLVIRDKDTLQQYAFAYSVFQAYRRSKDIGTSGGEDMLNAIQHLSLITHSDAVKVLLKPFQISNITKESPEFLVGAIGTFSKGMIDSAQIMANPYNAIEQLKSVHLKEKDWYALATNKKYPYAFTTHCMEQYLATQKELTLEQYRILLEGGNVAFISMAAEKMRTDSNWLSMAHVQVPYLKTIQSFLVMPRDFEAWVDLEKTICKAENRKYEYKSWFTLTGYRHPIDWEYVKLIPENLKIKITTNKGAFVMVLKINDAPGSVVNFLKLLDSNYYDKRYFHRMVPSFVVQGGCPRGDGWGSLNWTQRSELSNFLVYKPGSVGLASAGKDSEGVQFFVTHTWTPHLDGRYTIFAELIEGMEVINTLNVGDQILYIEKI
jgi:cyclophilin family peptidyl-prolyl cis-trans isomerase